MDDKKQWDYEAYQDLDNDLEELNRNLLNMSQQNAKKANKLLDRLKISKSEDRLRKTVKKLSGR
ncbi:MAG: hypothetical protein KH179_11680 [Blautia sp.]|jgi:ElaB/YqjD/DUF883 family membrane-anchored ribosome-binding protein|nr:hypothetical protein [Blautia sp.]